MAKKYVSLPLFPDAFYDYGIALQGQSYTLRFTYNERMKLYTIDLLSSDLTPIILGKPLIPNYPILLDYAIFPLTGYFYMYEKANIISEPYKEYPEYIDQYYQLTYIFDDGV